MWRLDRYFIRLLPYLKQLTFQSNLDARQNNHSQGSAQR